MEFRCFITFMLILGGIGQVQGGSHEHRHAYHSASQPKRIDAAAIGRAHRFGRFLSFAHRKPPSSNPRPHTLTKIAAALEVPISEIFQERAPQLGTLQCAVSSSGTCIMNLVRSGRGRRLRATGESYDPRQLQLLRLANYVIQTGDARLLDALDVLLGSLVQAHGRGAAPRAMEPPPAGGEEGATESATP